MPDYPSLSTLGGALRDYWNRAGSFPMTTSTGVMITPEDIQRGMDLGMSFSGGGLGIKAYHGSPHDFSAFDMSKIGTGEGAQAYGHGLYFADSEGVAKSYRDKLAPASADVAPSWKGNGWQVTTRDGNKFDRQFFSTKEEADIHAAQFNKGHMYEVNINADPEHFLDWDKPLSAQSEKVRSGVEQIWQQNPPNHPIIGKLELSDSDPGHFFFSKLEHSFDKAGTSSALREAGIPGIKYLDQGSRSAGEGSRNYVIFNDKLIDIVKKYGLAGLLGSGILATDRNQQ
jgi:hypothetical protein